MLSLSVCHKSIFNALSLSVINSVLMLSLSLCHKFSFNALSLSIPDKPEKIGNLKPEIIRALTELFLIVENLAQEWGVEQDLMVETISEECLMNWFEKVN